MSISEFIEKNNVAMLWEVISDEENFKFLTKDIQENVYQLFLNNIRDFFNNEKTKSQSLVDMNKKYILLIINYIKNNFNIQPNKITIHKEPVKETITYEEIQNERRSKFNKDLNDRQEEFKEAMEIKAPPVPNFSDKDSDEPIKDMDKILKRIQAQRNYEIEGINSSQTLYENVDSWLKPLETSVKSEKFKPVEQTNNYSRFEFLKTTEDDVNKTVKDKKNVSFSNMQEIQTFNDEEQENDDNIFSKLKKVSTNQTENIKLNIKEDTTLKNNFEDKRIDILEKEIININNKIDRILELLSDNHNNKL